jgi:prefoldin subunit 5
MPRTSKLKKAATKIGSAMGRADRTAHKIKKAGVVAREELNDLTKQIEALKRQLQKTTKRLKKALA